MGCGFLPECLARPYIAAGRLVVKTVDRPRSPVAMSYAWRAQGDAAAAGSRKTLRPGAGPGSRTVPSPPQGRALQWWLEQLAKPQTQKALLERHHSV